MKSALAFFVSLLSLVFFPNITLAQVTFEGCRDIRGVSVASIMDYSVDDVAIAQILPNGAPVIRYNPNRLSWFNPQTRLFWYAHECGHHARGHNFGTVHPLEVEQDADCFGIQTLVQRNLVTDADIATIQNDLARLGGGDWSHLPGPQRAIKLREQCLIGTSAPTLPPEAEDTTTRTEHHCQERYSSCMSYVRSVDQCIQDEFPQRCINACVSNFGYSYAQCTTQMCLPTASNLIGWRSRCQGLINGERENCTDAELQCRLQ